MQKPNSYIKLYEYFKEITDQSLFLKGFAGYFQRDLDSQIQGFNTIESPFLALWDYEKSYIGEHQNTMAIIGLGYVILKNDVPVDDFQAQYKAIDTCEQLSRHINSRLLRDHHNPDHFLFNSFLKEQTKIQPIDMKEVGFGVQVNVFFKNPEILRFDSKDWTEVDSGCKN